jgi:hypothetical protein
MGAVEDWGSGSAEVSEVLGSVLRVTRFPMQ